MTTPASAVPPEIVKCAVQALAELRALRQALELAVEVIALDERLGARHLVATRLRRPAEPGA